MQSTIVRRKGRNGRLKKKRKNEDLGKKIKREKENSGKLYKNGEKGLKTASFGVIERKGRKLTGVRPTCTPLPLEKHINVKRGKGGGDLSKCTI